MGMRWNTKKGNGNTILKAKTRVVQKIIKTDNWECKVDIYEDKYRGKPTKK